MLAFQNSQYLSLALHYFFFKTKVSTILILDRLAPILIAKWKILISKRQDNLDLLRDVLLLITDEVNNLRGDIYRFKSGVRKFLTILIGVSQKKEPA